ncbi:Limonene-1,2-epoxide hydrolase [Chitinophaga sp. CF118]|uniref:nuclear transport factor 2 family protein n=1 Tax=Chitinophaga sp. CF118 TaxID=1884367 RepID=UPI0008EB4649|nr:nuclear transport factor 2 family protein [Chitinophaga sp. CF118]SFE07734.1 Limonene-1,2-epoxide hydrolase [Chitinophaga sp. CF118]
MENHSVYSVGTAKEVVLALINAINHEDFQGARAYASTDMQFQGVLGAHYGAEAYFLDMEKMKLKYDIKRIFADGNDVCLLYNLDISGVTIFSCGWYHVEDGRVKSLKVVFDPRPILEKKK